MASSLGGESVAGSIELELGDLMLLYLDANIVQYIADYEDFILGESLVPCTKSGQLWKELEALRVLLGFALEIEQLEVANRWEVAAPTHLVEELLSGRPTPDQRRAYSILLQAWSDSDWREYISTSEEKVTQIERSLRSLNLRDDADRWHLAEAVALESSWFLTNDSDIIEKTRPEPDVIGAIRGVRVARPSECLRVLSANPVGGWSEHKW